MGLLKFHSQSKSVNSQCMTVCSDFVAIQREPRCDSVGNEPHPFETRTSESLAGGISPSEVPFFFVRGLCKSCVDPDKSDKMEAYPA